MATPSKHRLFVVPCGKGRKKVFAPNRVSIGDFVVGDDGYWAWWPEPNRGGCLPEYVLQELADRLHDLNEEWDKIVAEWSSCAAKPTDK